MLPMCNDISNIVCNLFDFLIFNIQLMKILDIKHVVKNNDNAGIYDNIF